MEISNKLHIGSLSRPTGWVTSDFQHGLTSDNFASFGLSQETFDSNQEALLPQFKQLGDSSNFKTLDVNKDGTLSSNELPNVKLLEDDAGTAYLDIPQPVSLLEDDLVAIEEPLSKEEATLLESLNVEDIGVVNSVESSDDDVVMFSLPTDPDVMIKTTTTEEDALEMIKRTVSEELPDEINIMPPELVYATAGPNNLEVIPMVEDDLISEPPDVLDDQENWLSTTGLPDQGQDQTHLFGQAVSLLSQLFGVNPLELLLTAVRSLIGRQTPAPVPMGWRSDRSETIRPRELRRGGLSQGYPPRQRPGQYFQARALSRPTWGRTQGRQAVAPWTSPQEPQRRGFLPASSGFSQSFPINGMMPGFEGQVPTNALFPGMPEMLAGFFDN